jgi:hypothetical protein
MTRRYDATMETGLVPAIVLPVSGLKSHWSNQF